ncbi:MAG: SLOG family protein [Pseudomonadota bacterium]
MKVVVCGGRHFSAKPSERLWLVDKLKEMGATEVVSGGCSGADKLGEWAASCIGLRVTKFPADWKKHGKSAGPRRNRLMAEYGDAVIAFPGGKGTDNMIWNAEQCALEVHRSSP